MNKTLQGKYVIITGASSGIGAKIAYKVAESGGNVVLLARSTDKLAELRDYLTKTYSIDARIYTLDVSDLDHVTKVFELIYQELDQIDVLINNAGFGIFDYVEKVKLEDIKNMFDVNVVGLIACTRMVVSQMIQRNSGHIINIASVAGKVSTPKSTVYSASKHAVLGFTNGLRMELDGTNVHVTAVNPGPIKTNFFDIADPEGDYATKMSRFMLDPDDVAIQVVNVIGKKKREINLPFSMSIGARLYQWFPRLSETIAGRFFKMK